MKNALYYPHIAFKDPNHIKAMALYYDNIYRIVPSDIQPDDPEELKALLEEGHVGKKINPEKYAKAASEHFLEKTDYWNAAALQEEKENEQTTRLHLQKIDGYVRELFHIMGYKTEKDWMNVPTTLASNFMLYLANEIASKNKLSLATGDWGAWTGTTYFSVDGRIDETMPAPIGNDNELGLFSLILNELTPINISEIPSSEIVAFRQKRKDEIALFRNSVEDLRKELMNIDSNEIREDIIREKINTLDKAQKDYRASADILNVREWVGTFFTNIPASIQLSQLFSIHPISSAILAATGIAIGAIVSIKNTREEMEKLKKNNPASFLIDINKSFRNYTKVRNGGDINFHAYNCIEEYIND